MKEAASVPPFLMTIMNHDYHDLGRGDGYGHGSLDQIKRIIDSVLW